MRKNKKKRLNRICMRYDLLEAIEELRDIEKQNLINIKKALAKALSTLRK